MINRVYTSAAASVADVPDGATVMIGGFGTVGSPARVIGQTVSLARLIGTTGNEP